MAVPAGFITARSPAALTYYWPVEVTAFLSPQMADDGRYFSKRLAIGQAAFVPYDTGSPLRSRRETLPLLLASRVGI